MQLKQAVSRDSENHPVRKVVVQQELIVSLLMREKMWIKNLVLIIMQTSFSKWSHGGVCNKYRCHKVINQSSSQKCIWGSIVSVIVLIYGRQLSTLETINDAAE